MLHIQEPLLISHYNIPINLESHHAEIVQSQFDLCDLNSLYGAVGQATHRDDQQNELLDILCLHLFEDVDIKSIQSKLLRHHFSSVVAWYFMRILTLFFEILKRWYLFNQMA